MESKTLILINIFIGQQWRCWHREQICIMVGEVEGGMNGERSIEAYTSPPVKEIASGNLLYDSGTSSWCSVTT